MEDVYDNNLENVYENIAKLLIKPPIGFFYITLKF